MKRFLAIGLTIALLVTALPVCSLALTQYATVQGGWLRLRSAPSFTSDTLSSYYTGTVVELLGSVDGWYKVKVPDGMIGYMYAAYLSIGGGGGGGGTGNATIWSANGYGVRMRSGPGKGYRVLAVYSVGTSVTILTSGSIWSKVQVGDRIGYIMNEFLNQNGGGGGGGDYPGTGEYARIWSPNGGGVRLRTGPGRGYGVIGVYSVGTRVEIISHGATWDQVRVGSRVGYMMNYYLRYYHAGLATGLSITPTYADAKPGQQVTLSVNVTGTNLSSPAYTLAITQNASLAYLDGNRLVISSDATAGEQIVVTATSVDLNSSGSHISATSTISLVGQGKGVATDITLKPASATVNQGSSVALYTTVAGINLSDPAYKLSVSDPTYAAISGDSLVVYGNAPIGTILTVTATTVDNDGFGRKLTAKADVRVTGGSSVVTYFNVSPASATATLSSSWTTVDLTPTVLGTNLAIPPFTVSVPDSLSSYVDYVIDSKTGVIHVDISSAIPEDTSFNVTVKAVNSYADGTVPQAVIPIKTVKNSAVKSFELRTQPSDTITQSQYVQLIGKVIYEDGSYADYVNSSLYSLSITSGDAYATLSGNMVQPKPFTGTKDQTVTLKGVCSLVKADGSQPTATCTVTIKAQSVPEAPTLEKAEASVASGEGAVTLKWSLLINDGGSPIIGFRAYRSSASGTQYKDVGKSADSAVFDKLKLGETYTVWVKAINANGESAESNRMSATPSESKPSAPTGLAVTSVSDGKVTLSWTAPYNGGSDITEYRAYYSKTGTIGNDYRTPAPVTANSLEITGLTNDIPYTFWVKAFNKYGESDASAPIKATPSKGPTVEITFIDLNTPSEATVYWKLMNDGGDPSITYALEYKGPIDGSIPVTASPVTIKPLTPGTYTFTLKATNSRGTGEAVQTDAVVGTRSVTSELLVASGADVTYTGIDPAAENGASGEAGSSNDAPIANDTVNPAPVTPSEENGSGDTNPTDTNPTDATQTDTIPVDDPPAALPQQPENGSDVADTQDTPVAAAPDAPIIGTLTAGDGKVTVHWTAPLNNVEAGIAKYRVYYGNTYLDTLDGFTTFLTIQGLTNGKTYTFCVTVIDGMDRESLPSEYRNATPAAAPLEIAPTNDDPSDNTQSDFTPMDDGSSDNTPSDFTPTNDDSSDTTSSDYVPMDNELLEPASPGPETEDGDSSDPMIP